MTYAEAKQRLDEWYAGNNVNISPEVLDCCYDAIEKAERTNALLEEIIRRINMQQESDTYECYDDYFRAGVDTGLENAKDIIAEYLNT